MDWRASIALGIPLALSLAAPAVAAEPKHPTPAAAPSSITTIAGVLPTSYSLKTNENAAAPLPQPATEAPAIDTEARRRQALRSAAMKWETAYLALSAVDAAETIYCLRKERCDEANPLLGKHPSTATILLFKTGLGALHYVLFRKMVDKNPRTALRLAQFAVAIQGGVVVLNAGVIF